VPVGVWLAFGTYGGREDGIIGLWAGAAVASGAAAAIQLGWLQVLLLWHKRAPDEGPKLLAGHVHTRSSSGAQEESLSVRAVEPRGRVPDDPK